MTITDERKANMSITDPYMRNKQVMVTKAENVELYSQSVDGVNVVAEVGSTGDSLAAEDEFFAGAKYVAVDSQAKALMDVAAGTSDVAVVDYVASIGSIGEGTDYANLAVIDSKEFAVDEYGVAFRKGSDMQQKTNAVIRELAEDGTLAQIAAKYNLVDLMIVK